MIALGPDGKRAVGGGGLHPPYRNRTTSRAVDMMSNDSQDAPDRGMPMDRAGSIGSTIRLDGTAGSPPVPGGASGGGAGGHAAGGPGGRAGRWARLERAWWLALVVT